MRPGRFAWPLLCVATTVAAQGLEGELQALHSRYDAFEPGPGGQGVYNREHGPLQGGAAVLRWQVGAWTVAGRLGRRTGTLAYEGLTQLGLPLVTTTHLAWNDAALHLRRGGTWADTDTRWAVQLGFEGLVQRRAIQPTPLAGALTETLRRHGPAVGLSLEQPLPLGTAAPLSLGVHWSWSRPWRQTLDVDAHGVFDALRLAPAHAVQRAWQLALRWSPAPDWTLAVQGGRQQLHIGEAPLQAVWRSGGLVGAVSYPGSHQRRDDVQVALAWRL